MTNVYKKWLKLKLKMAQCSVVYDLSFDMLDIATFWINHSETIMDRKICTGIKMIVSYTI